MRKNSRVIQALVAALPIALGAGGCCYSSHELLADGGFDAAPDASPDMAAEAPGPDAPLPDAPIPCPNSAVVRPSIFCTGTGAAAGLVLNVRVDGCFCGETFVCDVAVAGNAIRLSTRAEACGPLCDACLPLEGQCFLPSDLAAGTYAVRINDQPGFELTLATDGLLPFGVCFNPLPPPPDGTCVACTGVGSPVAADSACVPASVSPDGPVVVTAQACVPCFTSPAGCVIRAASDGYDLDPLSQSCDCYCCGGCAGVCTPQSFECELPPLAPGTYTVRVGGASYTVVSSSTGAPGNLACRVP